MKIAKLLPAIAASPLFLVGSVVLAADARQAQPVTVVATEYEFSPHAFTFKRGVPYRLHLENHGTEMHEFTAPQFFRAVELAANPPLNADKTEIIIQPGEAKDLTFVARQAGRFPLKCADHDWAGMTGEIVVK
jgi:uncharacterized cupredoxin-like copper-binding protein